MRISQKFQVINKITLILMGALAVTITLAFFNQQALNRAQSVRYDSYLRANELRMSSEDLTRLARTYVVTGDSKYEAQYWEILDVRNGKKPRKDGSTVALRELMKNLGFTDAEFSKLKEAEDNSNALVTTETIAMNAVKGLFDDGAGKYTRKATPDPEMAKKIMHDDKYHSDKALIMKPIDEFESMLDRRTEAAFSALVLRGNVLLAIIGVLSLTITVAIVVLSRSVIGVLQGVIAKLKGVIGQTVQSTHAVAESSTQLTSSSQDQNSSIQEAVSTLDQIAAMVGRSFENARTSTDAAKLNKENALEGQQHARDMIHAVNEIEASSIAIVRHVEESNRQLSEIMKIISDIGAKTKVINDIVFQTKLLSFNASVEAARAGESGKGFSVVAEEIGNLAKLSGNAATEISEQLDMSVKRVEEMIRDMSTKTHSLAEAAKAKVKQGASMASRCGDAFETVTQTISKMTEMMESITRASDEQARGVSGINEAMERINRATQENLSIAQQTEKFASDLKASAEELHQLVDAA